MAFYASLGVSMGLAMTSNCIGCRNSFQAARDELERGIRHIKTWAYTRQINGKTERLMQPSLREWGCIWPLYCPSTLAAYGLGPTPFSIASRRATASRLCTTCYDSASSTLSRRLKPIQTPPWGV